jgi:hypothetical protein
MVPFTFTGTLSVPLIDGQPSVPLPFNFAGQYKSKEIHDLNFTDAGTVSVSMGTIAEPGAKLIIVEHVPVVGASPVTVFYNGLGEGNPGKELAPGGIDLYYNPSPVSGITSISISNATIGRVRVWIFGG